MSDPIGWFARHRVASSLLMFLIVAGGLLTLPRITREVFPDITPDILTIRVAYPGASPDEVESAIVERIEERIDGQVGIRRVTSVANEGSALVTAELFTDADAQRVLEDVKMRIDGITSFPDDAEEPIVERPVIRNQVINVAVSGPVSERLLKDTAEQVRDELAVLPEVTNVDVSGVRGDEIAIELTESALRRYRLSFDQVAEAIRRASIELPGGVLKTEGGEIRIRTFGQAREGAEFEDLPLITLADGTRLLLGDVARVNDGFEERDQRTRFDGEPAALVRVYRVGNQSALEISAAVKRYVEVAQQGMPEGIVLTTWDDNARVLRGRIDTLLDNARSGLLLVLVGLSLFLKPRLAFWVSAGIPVAFLGALWVMPTADATLNVVSLFAFILVLGILVDDSIVVGENIYTRQREEGADPLEAAIEGTREVATPVTFGVLTTVLAFAPLLFVEGAAAVIWRQIPVVVIAALMFSLVKCYFVLPAHLGHVAKQPLRLPRMLRAFETVPTAVGSGLERAIERYCSPLLQRVLHARYTTLAASFAVVLITLGALFGGWVRFQFFPSVESDQVVASFSLPPSAPFETTRLVAERLEQSAAAVRAELEAEPGNEAAVEHVLASAGQRLGRARGRSSLESGANEGSVEVALAQAAGRSLSASEFARRWREKTGELPDVSELTFSSDLFSAGDAIDVELRGTDLVALRSVAVQLREALETFPGVRDVRDSYRAAKDEVELRLRPEAESLGLSVADLARQVRQAFFGEEVQRIARDGEDVKVMARYPLESRGALGDVESLRIRTAEGDAVPLSVVADVRLGEGPAVIRRADGARVVNVLADVDISQTSAQEVLTRLQAGVLPRLLRENPGVSYALEGEQREQRESLAGLGRGFVFALLGIFTLLAIPLRSYAQPLVVMATIPLGGVAAIAGHLALGIPVSFPSVIGMVALAGIVVNDSLVLVDWANRLRRDGMNVQSALLAAGCSRFRPVFLTSLTTFLGLLPLLLERSVQAQFLIPMAVSVAAGVLMATLISLIVVPAAYLVLDELNQRWQRVTFGLSALRAAEN